LIQICMMVRGRVMTLSILKGSWVGELRGTIVANLFAEFSEDSVGTKIVLRVNNQGAIAVFSGAVQKTENSTALAYLTDQSPAVASAMTATINFTVVDQQQLHGRWELPNGNAGVLTLVP